jgi:hypothetical protein
MGRNRYPGFSRLTAMHGGCISWALGIPTYPPGTFTYVFSRNYLGGGGVGLVFGLGKGTWSNLSCSIRKGAAIARDRRLRVRPGIASRAVGCSSSSSSSRGADLSWGYGRLSGICRPGMRQRRAALTFLYRNSNIRIAFIIGLSCGTVSLLLVSEQRERRDRAAGVCLDVLMRR